MQPTEPMHDPHLSAPPQGRTADDAHTYIASLPAAVPGWYTLGAENMARLQAEGSRILIIDDDPTLTRLLGHWLGHGGYAIETHHTASAGIAALSDVLPDAILLDLGLPDGNGLDVLAAMTRKHPRVPVVMITGETNVATVVAAMQAGAYDYITKPVDRTKLFTTVRNAVEKARADLRLTQLEREVRNSTYPGFIGQSSAMRDLYRQMDRVGPSDIRVLILGESGTGKELVARAMHASSSRSTGPFVAINCAAVPPTLQESELFGHEKGAFTGADRRRIGRLEQADGGTLFLDEVGELSLSLQAQLLRALQENAFFRVGGSKEVRVDVRLLAATHRDLERAVQAGSFREDLYYRLAVFELQVPPLRVREGDLPTLVRHYVREFAAKHSVGPLTVRTDAMDALCRYDWPGNVRQLQNAIESAAVLARDGEIVRDDLPRQILRADTPKSAATVQTTEPAPSLGDHLENVEHRAIRDALDETGGNLSEVVRRLGISRSTLYRRLRAMGLR